MTRAHGGRAGAPRWVTSRARRLLGRATGIVALTSLAAGTALSFSPPADAATGSSVRIFAHRGGTKAGPEATMAAFQHVIDVKADGIEFDVRFTKDGVPVLLHDDTLDRTTDCRGPVAKLTFALLRRCDAGSWFSPKYAGQRVPTVDEALAFLSARSSTLKILLHMRNPTGAQARAVVKIVNRYHLNTPRARAMAGTPRELSTMRSAGMKNLVYGFQTVAGWKANFPVILVYKLKITAAQLKAAHRKHQQVLVVEDHPYSISRLLTLGVDGVLANDLDRALSKAGRLHPAPPSAPAPKSPTPATPAGGAPTDSAPGAGGGTATGAGTSGSSAGTGASPDPAAGGTDGI